MLWAIGERTVKCPVPLTVEGRGTSQGATQSMGNVPAMTAGLGRPVILVSYCVCVYVCVCYIVSVCVCALCYSSLWSVCSFAVAEGSDGYACVLQYLESVEKVKIHLR